MNIRLTTPAQHTDENPAVELNQRQLENWLSELSTSNIVETVETLDRTISAFNELKVADSDRLDLLEVYFASFQQILQGFDEMRIAQLSLPSKQKQQLANDIMWLHIKLSHGYKIIVKNNTGISNQQKQPLNLLLVTFRSLELTVVSLLYAYRFGMDIPPLTYLDLHQLYAYAENNELLGKPVKAAKGYPKTPSIDSFYVLALIFISIDPRQYESYTLEVLFLALQPFTFNCSFMRAFEPEADSYIYKINISENEMPGMLANNDLSIVNEWIRYLDIENFILEINAWLDENNNNKSTFLIEQELELFPAVVTRLKVLRNEKVAPVVEGGIEESAEKTSKLVVGLSQIESLLITKAIDLGIRLTYKTSSWTLCSESSTGCELSGNVSEIDEDLTLGDLVAIVNEGSETEAVSIINVAQVCGLDQLEQGRILLRLEYLNGSAYPLTYILASKDGEADKTIQSNGVYLLSEDNNDESLLVVNKRHYKERQQYVIKTREKICKVEATKLVKQTLRYVFLQYETLQEEPNTLPGVNNIFNVKF